MIGAPIRNAYLDDATVIEAARRAAWAILNDKPHPGYRKLGNGHFSRVFSITASPGLVLKVGGPGTYGQGGTRYSAYGGCDVWPHYVHYTAGLSPRPEWAPRVYHVEDMSPGFYFAVLERLEERRRPHLGDMIPGTYYGMLDAEGGRRGYINDLHPGNFMTRVHGGQRTVVITDPWLALG